MSSEENKTVSIIRGEERKITLRIRDEDTQDPIDLSTATGLTTIFKGTTGNITATTVLDSGVLGRVIATLTEAQTMLLKIGTSSCWFQFVLNGGETRIVEFSNIISVKSGPNG